MRKGKSLLGLSIVGQEDGKVIGTVKDLLFDHDTDELLAMVLAEKDLFGLIDAVIVPWHQVRNIGGDVILVESSKSRINLKDDERARSMTKRETVLSGTQVLTSEGQHLGTLADMCIDEKTGRIIGYEVSGGFIKDSLRGKKFLPAPPGLSIGKDAAIARPEAEARLKQGNQAIDEKMAEETTSGTGPESRIVP
jgi:uncharacterized protein YrrD